MNITYDEILVSLNRSLFGARAVQSSVVKLCQGMIAQAVQKSRCLLCSKCKYLHYMAADLQVTQVKHGHASKRDGQLQFARQNAAVLV